MPVVASPDLDILNDKSVVRRLVTALGHDWDELDADYDIATQPFRQPREQTRVRDVRDQVARVLDDALSSDKDIFYSAALREQVLAALRSQDSPWHALKQYGERGFKGQAAQAAEQLLARLEQRGVIAVRVGELEGFAPKLGVTKGKEWLAAALGHGAHRQTDVQGHIARLLARPSRAQAAPGQEAAHDKRENAEGRVQG